jgi:aryl-alcohol dehydrogenase-like predicted oxidoreductase
MQYRILGTTGVQVSTLGPTGVQVSTPVLGAMNFGRLGRTTQAR